MADHFQVTDSIEKYKRVFSVFDTECTGVVCQHGHLWPEAVVVKAGHVVLDERATFDNFLYAAYHAGLIRVLRPMEET